MDPHNWIHLTVKREDFNVHEREDRDLETEPKVKCVSKDTLQDMAMKVKFEARIKARWSWNGPVFRHDTPKVFGETMWFGNGAGVNFSYYSH
jgi:hypothetical protein